MPSTIHRETLADWLLDSCGLKNVEYDEDLDTFVWGPLGFVCAGPDESCIVTIVVIDLDDHGNRVIDTTNHDDHGPFHTHADLREAICKILRWAVKVALAVDAVTENPMRKPDVEDAPRLCVCGHPIHRHTQDKCNAYAEKISSFGCAICSCLRPEPK